MNSFTTLSLAGVVAAGLSFGYVADTFVSINQTVAEMSASTKRIEAGLTESNQRVNWLAGRFDEIEKRVNVLER